jgi:hypothetical protein
MTMTWHISIFGPVVVWACLASATALFNIEDRQSNTRTVVLGKKVNGVAERAVILQGFDDCNANSNGYGTSVHWETWIVDGLRVYIRCH